MNTYSIAEIFYSIQGEGARAGRPAVFVRFAGCNLWSGKDSSRNVSAGQCARWCDTDFAEHFRASRDEIVAQMIRLWPGGGKPYAIFTGGEPALQLDDEMVLAAKLSGFECAIETNGTRQIPSCLDWVTVSPKTEAFVVRSGDELKVVYPQQIRPETFEGLQFSHFFLQPRDFGGRMAAEAACLEYVLAHPRWRLSVQLHKFLGIK